MKKIRDYFEVGRLLHLITFLAIIISMITFLAAYKAYIDNNYLHFYINGALFLHFVSLPFFAQMDAWCRFQNFKMVCDMFYKYGYHVRFIKALSHSKCQREAALRAAKNLLYEKEVGEYFFNLGYRWYHIFPDFIWKHPDYLFTKHFWLTTFFTKKYKPRYFIY